jgi:hypothetical protein
MVNSEHLLEDLKLTPHNKQRVNGINKGLTVAGEGTFQFRITNDNGRHHTIRILNSLYLPCLKSCLLSPQHWAQEAGDNQTFMGNFAHCCTLHWGDGFKTIPFNPATNTPIFHTAPASCTCRAFTATYEACEVAFYHCKTVLQVPGLLVLREAAELDPSKFVAVENLNLCKKMRENVLFGNDINEDDKIVQTKNPPLAHKVTKPATPDQTICIGPLTFDPTPQASDNKDTSMAAANDQAELMRWHYRLGHLSFEKLKQLTLNGKISKKFAKIAPPKCAGCLFGAMTKLPWHGKKSKSSHKVFVTTKPGETVSVDQMVSTKARFFAQLKGTFTKKHYKCTTIFVDHFSQLRFVHLQIDDSAVETLAAKQAFEAFAAKHGVRIQHYHCDNGRFSDNAFRQACHNSHQHLTFCGVNAHFQNGIAECAIRDLSKSAQKQLLHARA